MHKMLPTRDDGVSLEKESESDSFSALLRTGNSSPFGSTQTIQTGIIVGIIGDDRTPLLVPADQANSSPLAARTIVDIHSAHVGKTAVLAFEDGDRSKPIILGVLRQEQDVNVAIAPGTVEVDADGERLMITAKNQLVLQCGKSRITLTKAGKVLIEGTYVSTRSAGAIRIKGAAIQLN